MMIIDDELRKDLLSDYNNIVKTLFQSATDNSIQKTKISTNRWRENYAILNMQVEQIKSKDPELFRINNYEIMDLNLIDDENVLKVLLYSAIMKQWPSLDLNNYFSEEQKKKDLVFGETKINTINENLDYISSRNWIENLLNPTYHSNIKSLLRTLALYFYIRVAWNSMEVNLGIILRSSFGVPRSINNINHYFQPLLNDLCHTSVIKRIFKGIISGEGNEYERKLEDLFSYAIRNSYYCELPENYMD